MDGPAVVAAYRDLYQAGRSLRMTKSDLAARPVFHRLEDTIQAHLTIVFAALAISREAQARAGLSINKILKVLRPLRSATVTIGAQQVTAQPRIPPRPEPSSTTSAGVVTKPLQLRPGVPGDCQHGRGRQADGSVLMV